MTQKTPTMTTYYAVADVNGPISVKIEAESISEAIDWFLSQDEDFAADARIDAEDDLGFCGAGLDHDQMVSELASRGLERVSRDMLGDYCWQLWQV